MSNAALIEAARKAGAEGVSFSDFASLDSTIEAATSLDPEALDVPALEVAHAEGVREYRAKTWVSCWTTASERYDHFGTHTVEGPFSWEGKELRRVLMHPNYADQQRARYWSGLCGDWDEDPREVERKIREELSCARIEKFVRGVRAACGAAWLASLSDHELKHYDEDERDELLRCFGLDRDHPREERERRAALREASERAAEWARCRVLVPDGATLIDEGTPGFRGTYGWIAGRPKDAWRLVKVEPHYAYKDDAEQARVVGEGPTPAGTYVGSLAYVAGRIEAGEMRLARPDEHVPPRAVVDRIGRPFDEVLRVEEGGRVVWVGRPTFATEPMVLDDDAKIVRSKKVREAAAALYWQKERDKWAK